jgi:hypothetical protein
VSKRSFAVALLAAVVCSALSASEPTNADRDAVQLAAREIRSAILRKDIDALLAHVSTLEGLTCTDSNYPYREVRRYLNDRSSHLYVSLFDSTKFAARCGSHYSPEYPAVSDKEFFERVGESRIDVTFFKDEYVTVRYSSPISSYYPREYELHREHGQWKIVEGFIIGYCSCG